MRKMNHSCGEYVNGNQDIITFYTLLDIHVFKIEPFLISVDNKINYLYSISWLLAPFYIHKKLIGFVNSVSMIHHITEYYLAVCALHGPWTCWLLYRAGIAVVPGSTTLIIFLLQDFTVDIFIVPD